MAECYQGQMEFTVARSACDNQASWCGAPSSCDFSRIRCINVKLMSMQATNAPICTHSLWEILHAVTLEAYALALGLLMFFGIALRLQASGLISCMSTVSTNLRNSKRWPPLPPADLGVFFAQPPHLHSTALAWLLAQSGQWMRQNSCRQWPAKGMKIWGIGNLSLHLPKLWQWILIFLCLSLMCVHDISGNIM